MSVSSGNRPLRLYIKVVNLFMSLQCFWLAVSAICRDFMFVFVVVFPVLVLIVIHSLFSHIKMYEMHNE
jgi:hypothetical protein